MSRTSIVAAATFVALVATSVTPSANKNFMSDWTFTGSSLAETAQLGDAKWTAENGEVTGSPSSADGGILLFKNPLQDVQLAASFRCSAGCQAGLMLRVEQTPEGYKGVLVSISDTPGAFAVTLDRQGRLKTKEPLVRASGTSRFLAATPPPGAPGATQAPGRGGNAGAAAAGAPGRGGAPGGPGAPRGARRARGPNPKNPAGSP
jgi:hypothetical protein